MDSKAENFIRTAKDNLVTVTTRARENCFLNADRILFKLEEIMSGKYKTEEFDIEKVLSVETDKAKLFKTLKPEEIDASGNVIEAYKQML